MIAFLITYDLHRPAQNYPKIEEAIHKLGTWCHLQQSVWIVKTDSSSENLRDYLMDYIDSDDALFVTELRGISAWTGVSLSNFNWLQSQL